MSTISPDTLAQQCSAALDRDDHASHALGMRIRQTLPGKAVLEMTVRKDMTNGHAICHGGMIFTLADSAFAHACNNTNKITVASGCSIDFLAPAHEGDVLTATAQERSRSGRTGVYDIEVHKQDGTLIAVFRGKSYQLQGSLVTLEEENL